MRNGKDSLPCVHSISNVAVHERVRRRWDIEATACIQLYSMHTAIQHAYSYTACIQLYSMHTAIQHAYSYTACIQLYSMHTAIQHAYSYTACIQLYSMHTAITLWPCIPIIELEPRGTFHVHVRRRGVNIYTVLVQLPISADTVSVRHRPFKQTYDIGVLWSRESQCPDSMSMHTSS